ncbi:MAG TPA: bifunctional methylenetetrahydrofolate dehydrogenase/methenyltetrahydrofolate cyclohydrolase FolD [Polyangia bacterium]|nr:bifunctional methylenetetrahydrofolate dehydrogenase/methenyltetrahydrofolate cyclohydrolase FolD [Polyangia bacterium]
MSARIIDGKAIAASVRAQAAAAAAKLTAQGRKPGLAVVLVGDDPASQIYVRGKSKAALEAGLRLFDHKLEAGTRQDQLEALVQKLNADPTVHAILVQLPLPPHLDSTRVLEAIAPAKDVDGFHPVNVGRLWSGRPIQVPCTPAGIMRLLEETHIPVQGAQAVVIGRSNIVGKPMAALLLAANATVTLCHSKTRDLPAVVGRADIVVAALGKPAFVRGQWIRPGATVIDVGMNRDAGGKLCGDVEFAAAAERAGAITPVPGGVGPMTIAMLVAATVEAAGRAAD